MLLAINLLYLIPGQVGGTETYARELIPRLLANRQSSDRLIIYCARESIGYFTPSPALTVRIMPFFARYRFIRILFEQLLLPLYLWFDRVDCVFSLGYSTPLFTHCPRVVTIHDLNWYFHPEDFTRVSAKIWELMTRASAKSADLVLTDSLSSASDLHQILRVPNSKLVTILHAAPTPQKLTSSHPQITFKPYILTVVSAHPHKNLSTLIDAFSTVHQKYPNLNLVVCGLAGRSTKNINHQITQFKLKSRIHILGYVTNDLLAELYKGAQIFVFPSAYEGFGYPVLEAMSYGVPVISSRATSLTQVVGSGGILVDPYDHKQYSNQIIKLLSSPKDRQSLVKKGHSRLTKLKWDQTALMTWQAIYQSLKHHD